MSALLTWDNAAIALAVAAVLLRLADRPRAATIASSLTLLAATIGQAVARRARRPERVGAGRDGR